MQTIDYYDGLLLTDSNSNEVAKGYGWKSGKKLMEHFRSVRDSQTERRKSKHSRKYLETIIPLLTTENGKQNANEDLINANQ